MFVLGSDGGGLGQGGGHGKTVRKATNSRRLGAVSFVHLRIPGFQNSAWSIIYTLKILVESLNE